MSLDLSMTDSDWTEATRLESHLISRFNYLQNQRADLDVDIADEIEAYNNLDSDIENMPDNFRKTKVPFMYSQVQTIVARLIRSFFEGDNYLKVFMERKEFLEIQEDVTRWAQEEMDKIGLKYHARDFLEQSLVSRVAWLVLRPVNIDLPVNAKGDTQEGYNLKFDVHPYREVWFDTKAKVVDASDFFIKKVVPISVFHRNPDKYFNLDKIVPRGLDPQSNDSLDIKTKDLADVDYRAKNYSAGSENGSGPSWRGAENNGTPLSGTDLIEVHEYYGEYDFSNLQPGQPGYKPEIKEIYATIVNGRTLVHYQTTSTGLKRKRMIFPIRPISQAGTLIGKSIPQITKQQQHQLNLAETLRMTNYENQTGLLFKYNKRADIDLEDIFNGPGNAIGWDESPDDIDIFQQPNLIGESNAMISDIKNDIQATTGAVDAVVGGPNIADTASGQQSQINQANFKFQMMTENVSQDLRDFVNYCLIFLIKNNRQAIEFRHPQLTEFLDQSIEELEDNYAFDILLRDAAVRRDVEQAQWANMVGIIGPLLQQTGGNVAELTRQLLLKFGMPYPERVTEPESPDQIVAKLQGNPQLAAQVMQIMSQLAAEQQTGGGAGGQTTPAPVQTAEAQNAQLNTGLPG